MNYFFVFIIFFYSSLFPQSTKKADSILYYNGLRNSSIQTNNYKEALLRTQKAILYATRNKNIEDQAHQNYNLGKIYFDLKEYDDAMATFSKSVTLFSSFESH